MVGRHRQFRCCQQRCKLTGRAPYRKTRPDIIMIAEIDEQQIGKLHIKPTGADVVENMPVELDCAELHGTIAPLVC
jgi:hypothetical protein